MPGVVRIKDKKQLIQLIEAVEAEGGDASEFKRELECELEAMAPSRAQSRSRNPRTGTEELVSKECSKCGKSAEHLIAGLCPSCYKATLENSELDKVERSIYKKALWRGDISLREMKDDILNQP